MGIMKVNGDDTFKRDRRVMKAAARPPECAKEKRGAARKAKSELNILTKTKIISSLAKPSDSAEARLGFFGTLFIRRRSLKAGLRLLNFAAVGLTKQNTIEVLGICCLPKFRKTFPPPR